MEIRRERDTPRVVQYVVHSFCCIESRYFGVAFMLIFHKEINHESARLRVLFPFFLRLGNFILHALFNFFSGNVEVDSFLVKQTLKNNVCVLNNNIGSVDDNVQEIPHVYLQMARKHFLFFENVV